MSKSIQPTPQNHSPMKIINGCLTSYLLSILCVLAVNELKISTTRLEIEETKLEKIRQDTLQATDKEPKTLKLDTLKIGKYEKTYVPLLRLLQKEL